MGDGYGDWTQGDEGCEAKRRVEGRVRVGPASERRGTDDLREFGDW